MHAILSYRGKRRALLVRKLLGDPKFRPTADPFQGAQDGQNLISWRRSLPSPIGTVWSRSMHTIFNYRGKRTALLVRKLLGDPKFRVIVVTDPQTHGARPPQTGPVTSDGVLEDMSLASRILEDNFYSPWPCGLCPCLGLDLVDKVLEFTKDTKLAVLRPLLEKIFSVPATSATVERVFGHSGLIMRPNRARMSAECCLIS